MSKKLRQVTVTEFCLLIEFARDLHSLKNEPIPSFQNSKLPVLESCLQTPFTGFEGLLFYRGLIHKASMLFYLLARNHVLTNGNKRLACLTTSYFCFLNGWNINKIPDEVFYQLAKDTVLANENDKRTTIKKIEKVINEFKVRL